MVRGPEGAAVRLRLGRGGQANPVEAAVTRARVLPPVVTGQLLPDNVGYVRVYSFPATLIPDLESTLAELERRGARAWVIDLRDNAGGQLDVVTKATSLFVPSGPIFQQVRRNGDRETYRSDGSVRNPRRPIAVLINKGTSSGGEIFAAAIQESQTGRLIGTKSAGCVSTGRMFPLPDGSALELAVARIITGRGQELNKVGVTPDDTIELAPQDLAGDRDPQLDQALRILGGR